MNKIYTSLLAVGLTIIPALQGMENIPSDGMTKEQIQKKLESAVKSNDTAVAERMLKLGADANSAEATLLMSAVLTGKEAMVSLLLFHFADVNSTRSLLIPQLFYGQLEKNPSP